VADVFLLARHDQTGANLLANLRRSPSCHAVSYALVVRNDSPLQDWAGLVALARGSRPRFRPPARCRRRRFCSTWSRSGQVSHSSRSRTAAREALDLVLKRSVALASIDTRLALLHNETSNDKVRVLATFGAQRSPNCRRCDLRRDRGESQGSFHAELRRVRRRDRRRQICRACRRGIRHDLGRRDDPLQGPAG
jgi:hypothetical protein